MRWAKTGDFELLRLSELSKQYDDRGAGPVSAVDRLSLTVQKGEFVALLGPSGSGKSTTLNLIAGLHKPTSGTIWLDDVRIDGLAPERRGFGMVFQNYALFPHLSVRKNVAFGLKMRGITSSLAKTKVEHALRIVQLEGFGDELPRQLSGGQQQRVAIARAIVIEPPLVLMDEPLSNLDAKLRIETRAAIRKIHRDLGRTTIYVTHDQDEALSLADRVVVLNAGAVQQIATPHELYAHPANLAVARFMGYRTVVEFPSESHATGARVPVARAGLRWVGTVKQEIAGPRACAAIRPEDFTLRAASSADSAEGRVESVESYGSDSLVDVVIGDGVRIHARTSMEVTAGTSVQVAVLPNRVLLYPAPDTR